MSRMYFNIIVNFIGTISQGHPNDPELQSTHPHHKHIPPDMKHHRVPAPDISFKEPNLTFLIREIEKSFF